MQFLKLIYFEMGIIVIVKSKNIYKFYKKKILYDKY